MTSDTEEKTFVYVYYLRLSKDAKCKIVSTFTYVYANSVLIIYLFNFQINDRRAKEAAAVVVRLHVASYKLGMNH